MEDIIISGGKDRKPGDWRKRLVIGLVLVAVAGVLIAEHLPKGGRDHPASGAVRRHHVHVPGQHIFAGPLPAAPVPIGAAGHLAGLASAWSAAERVPRTGSQPDWFWPSIGLAEPILGLPRHESGYVFTRLPGGWAIQPEPAGYEGCAGCPGPAEPVYYLSNQSGTAWPIGSATMVAAGGDQPRAMWLTSFPAHTSLGTVGGTARPYTSAGAPAGPAVRLPAGYEIAQATSRGLLLLSMSARVPAGTYLLWDPATRTVVRRLTSVLAASGREVASVPQCTATCAVRLLDLRTGDQRMIRLRAGRVPTGASFSPDGRYLALELSWGSGGEVGSLGTELDVASVAAGRVRMVPDTGVSSDALTGFGWPGEDDGLVAEFSFAARVQVALWSPGTATLAVTAVRPDQDPAALVIG